MHDHTFDSQESALRPKAARLEAPVEDHVGRAADDHRTDVLGPGGILDLQRAVGNSGVTSMLEEERSPVHDVITSGGRPLEPDVRTDMEGRLGADFGDVRVHDDGAAHDSAKAVNAHAYTVGSNVVFQRDKYDPSSADGKVMLAHELTHVVQQRSGPVDGTSAPGGISVSDPSDRFEREASANAERAMSVQGPTSTLSPAAPQSVQRALADSAEAPFVQRDGAPEEEEPVQTTAIQRAEEEEEEPA